MQWLFVLSLIVSLAHKKTQTLDYQRFELCMQKMGVEPTRYCYHTDLNRARLPIPPLLPLREMGLEPTRAYTHKILSLACLPIPALPQLLLRNVSTFKSIYDFDCFVKRIVKLFLFLSCMQNTLGNLFLK